MKPHVDLVVAWIPLPQQRHCGESDSRFAKTWTYLEELNSGALCGFHQVVVCDQGNSELAIVWRTVQFVAHRNGALLALVEQGLLLALRNSTELFELLFD